MKGLVQSESTTVPVWLLSFNTYIVVFSVWDQDVHLRALGADNVAVERIFTQVHLAALRLVDGDGWNSSQHLQKDI